MHEKRTMLPSVVRVCDRCHTEFRVFQSGLKRGQGKYCSRRCYGDAKVGRERRRAQTTCEACGVTFEIHVCRLERGQGRYCSVLCKNGASRTRQVVACKQCGGFVIPPNRMYCSKACYSAYLRANRRAVRMTIRCGICGTDFEARPCDIAKGQARFCSLACFGKFKSRHPEIGGHHNHKGGKRADLGGLYVRSRWEANWARYLNFLKAHGEILDWVYEPETFEFPIKRGTRFYTPDFKVTLPDGSVEYHEVKGWMTAQSKTRSKRMAKYYPHIKIVMVERTRYQGVARTMRALIPEWEWDAKKSN